MTEETEEKQEEQEKPKEPEKPAEEAKKPEAPKTPKPQAPKAAAAEKAEENVVFIGRKPIMNYVIACVTFFNTGEKEICVKARGRAISRAVDTIELLRRSFVKDLQLKEIKLGTEEMSREGRKSNVSTIEISVAKA